MLNINLFRSGNEGVIASRRTFGGRVIGLAAAAMLPGRSFAGAFEDFFKFVALDNPREIEALLKRGFDPNVIEAKRGDTGLILALRESSMKVFDVLLRARGINIEAKAFNGDSALMIAAYKGNKPAVEALLAKGAEVNRPGWTPLHYAAAVGNTEIVQLFLDKSAYIDAESPSKMTPIMMAAAGGHIYTVKLLLDEGADATLKNSAGMTAIDLAQKADHKDIAEGLTYRLKKAGKL
jgi:ankyrin repeat protein